MFQHITNDKEMMKKIWKLSFIQMKLLNNIACKFELNFNSREMGYKLLKKALKICKFFPSFATTILGKKGF
jgi:hypothetical protein